MIRAVVPPSAVIHSPSASASLDAAARWIEPLLGHSEVLIVGATRAAADEFVRALPVSGTFGLHRMTLGQLAASLAAAPMAETGMAGATRLAIEAIAARVLHRAGRQDALKYFAPVAKSPGFPAALSRTVRDLRLARISAAEISGSPAAQDIGLLLELSDGEIESRKLADLAAVLEMATGSARTAQHPLLGLPLLLLDVPLPSVAHIAFLAAIAQQAPAVCATALTADTRRVDTLSQTLGVTAQAVADGTVDALVRVREQLFATRPPTPMEYGESVQLFSAPGEALEGVEIARRIRRLAGEGAPFDSFAVVLRQPDRYQPLIEEALRRAGIPAYFSRGTARPDPAGRAFLALLACASEGCSASRFAEYLSLGQVPPLDDTGSAPRRDAPWTAPDDEVLPTTADDAPEREQPVSDRASIPTPLAWEKLLVDASVIGGYERWARRLRGLENEFHIQLASLGADQEDDRARIERDLDRLAALERFALPLIEDLHALPSSADWGEWLDSLARLAARCLANPESVLSVLSELRPMADVGPAELDEVAGVLRDRLRTLRRDPPHRRYGCVFVGSIDEVRGRVFDVVFLPGLAEGLFPQKASEDPLLLDHLRRAISDALTTRTDVAAEERLLLRTAVAAARRRFVASYPSMDLGQGRPRVPSFYALEIARAIEGRVPPLRAFETRLSENSEARLVWPAPGNPNNAIDDAEYDLAWLAAHREESGGARYLLDANPHLARSLRARWRRWKRKWTEADGFVDPDQATRELLGELRLTTRAYSPSSLQHFSACPYRFVLSGILRLRERQEAAAIEQLDPLTRGALVHEVQREFLRWFRREPATNRDVLLARLDETLARVSQDYAERIAPAIVRVWDSEIEDIRTDLRGWMVEWHAQLDEWEPLYFELAFGLPPDPLQHDEASYREPVELPGVRVHGSIDLVERHRRRGTLRITDHKTGRTPDSEPTSVDGGRVLQPVLYALAAERMLNTTAEMGRLWYCTQRGAYNEQPIEINAHARDRFSRAMAVIDEAVATGFLPAAPAKDACKLCDYRAVCGPNEEVRVKLWKERDALSRLNELRSLP